MYCKLAQAGKLAKGRNDFGKALWGKAPFEALTEDGGLKSELFKWAAHFHADAPWLTVGALRTLRCWYVFPELHESLEWEAQHGRRDLPIVGKRFEFSHSGWEVQLLTWPAYSCWLRKSLEEKLLIYEKETREFVESRGLVRARRKYSPDNLEWFVFYQFAGMSSTRIVKRCAAKGKDLEESAVLKGIKAAANLIEWGDLRASWQGRNRKIRPEPNFPNAR